jgi:two-component system response regulator AtoC
MTEPSVLVVDDEENLRHMLGLLLRKERIRVQTASNGDEALARLQSEDFDVVLCDLRMPGLDGMALLEKLRELRVASTVIVMSAYADQDTALGAIKAGAFDYVAKPFRNDELVFTLRKALEHRTLRRENETLRLAARGGDSFAGIVARSQPMLRVFATIRKVADYRSTVLLSGESGTGKEMFARALHTQSSRSAGPFVAVNCGAIPETLLESELFGARARGVHRRQSRQARALRRGQRWHALSRRNRRHARFASGEAAARASGR